MADEERRRTGSRRTRKKKVSIESRRQVEFTYRGRSIQDLQALSMDEVVQLLPSRARRFLARLEADGGSEHTDALKFLEKVQASSEGDSLRTHLREFPILPAMVNRTIEVHNGKEFKRVEVLSEMIGHKLGEFAPTRGSVSHTGPGVGATRSSKFMPLK